MLSDRAPESKPSTSNVQSGNIPASLQALHRWVAWNYRWHEQRQEWGKIPINPRSGANAMSNEAITWGSFDQAMARYKSDNLSGVGIVLGDGLSGVDLDHSIAELTGEPEPWAKEILDGLSSYTEVSPSGTGVHALVWAAKPGGRCVTAYGTGKVEIYGHGRYFTVTGKILSGSPPEVHQRQDALDTLHRRLFPPEADCPIRRTKAPIPPPDMDDAEIVRRASEAKNGPKFSSLWAGDRSGYTSDSEADLALCSLLAFWTGPDPERIDRLFRQSGLMRDKWDRKDYRRWTIGKALKGRTESCHGLPKARPVKPAPPPSAPSPTVPESAAGLPLTDLGNGKRLASAERGRLRHCHPWKEDLVWDGKRWRRDDTAAVERAAKTVVLGMVRDAAWVVDDDRRAVLLKHALKTQAVGRIHAMMTLARSEPHIPVLPADLDQHPWLFNCDNGTLDLRTGQLRKHDPDDLLTMLSPTRFDPAAACPIWEVFLAEVFQWDAELIRFVQQLFGRCLSGDVSEQMLPIFWGEGQNGKSTLVNAVREVLGPDCAMKANQEFLIASRGERHPTELASLFGKRLVVVSETSEGGRLNESLIKDLTGGEPILARRMREDFWEFKPTHKVVMLTNHKPEVRGTDTGIWRRLRLVPFEQQFWDTADPNNIVMSPPSGSLRADKQLGEKLKAEHSGILAWLVQGCLDWQRNGLSAPTKVVEATTAFRQGQDLLGQWLEECCVMGQKVYRSRLSDLLTSYNAWREARQEPTVKSRTFSDLLTERGFEKQRSDGVWFTGIALTTNYDARPNGLTD